jgi:methylated-DNA-[protein]-cysteine S-methyltransferase
MAAMPTTWTVYESPLGPLTVTAGPRGLTGIHFPGRSPRLAESARGPLLPVANQLDEYFAGERRRFELELDLHGSALERQVWERLLEIPYGATVSYGELAKRLEPGLFPPGLEQYRRVRMAAAAIGRTPTPIVVPCHRVIAADGSLRGYGGGLRRKRALLELEGRVAAGLSPDPVWGEGQAALF